MEKQSPHNHVTSGVLQDLGGMPKKLVAQRVSLHEKWYAGTISVIFYIYEFILSIVLLCYDIFKKSVHFSDPLVDFHSFWTDYLYNKNVFVSSLQHRFSTNETEHEMINKDQYWTITIPHESSGPCYTYDPPFDSYPGFDAGMYLIMNSTTTDGWDPNLEIFFHDKGKFFYQDDNTVNTVKVELSKLRAVLSGNPRISSKLKIYIRY